MAEAAVRHIYDTEPLPIVGELNALPWLPADVVPQLAQARTGAASRAYQVQADRMELLRDGDYDSVPYAVDALSTAGRYLKAAEEYGARHPVALESRQSLDTDCLRLMGEGARAFGWEYYAELEQPRNPVTGGYTFMGRELDDMTTDGITPVAEPEEAEYRIVEYVEEATYKEIRNLGRLALGNVVVLHPATPQLDPEMPDLDPRPDLRVLTVTECSDMAIESYQNGATSGFGGHVPQIEKFMIRGIRYDQTKDSRYQHSIALSGENITREIIIEGMQLVGALPAGANPSKREVRATQMINLNGHGPIEFTELLDELASRASGKRIFLGEIIPDDQPKDYASVPAIAAARARDLEQNAKVLSDYVVELKQQGVDPWLATTYVENKEKELFIAKTRQNPQEAAMAFGEATGQGFAEVIELRRQGNYRAALRLESEVIANAPPPPFCGAGSCGLVAISEGDSNEVIARKLGLKGELLLNTESKCTHCNERKLVHDMGNSTVCVGCESKRFGGVTSISSNPKHKAYKRLFATTQKSPAKSIEQKPEPGVK